MQRLLFRSILVLALLFGLLYAVGTAVLYRLHLPLGWALGFSVAVVALQYALGPFILEWFFKIRWVPPAHLGPDFDAFLRRHCAERGLPMPRFGIIEDGNPNAFTFGHVPGNARVVVTRGLVDMLTPDELHAVVAHEMGHVAHYDFLVMAVASLVPLMLYQLYIWARDDRKQATLAVAVGAYVAYVVSQMGVLMLSRIREFFADQHASESVPDGQAIASALMKIAYGMATLPQEAPRDKEARKDPAQMPSRVARMGALGIGEMQGGAAFAMAAADATGRLSEARMEAAMRWDLWNPWARWYELFSTHPTVARRVAAALERARLRGQAPRIALPGEAPTSLWPAFFRDLLVSFLPVMAVALGVGVSGLAAYLLEGGSLFDGWRFLGLPLAFWGIGLVVRWMFAYRGPFTPTTVADLVGTWDVSQVKGIPAVLKGTVIGRGVPGLFWSKDLVLQDETGFVTVLYQQPFHWIETLFGMFRAQYLVGQEVIVSGWFRRGPGPAFEAFHLRLVDGSTVRCYHRHGQLVFAGLMIILGVWLAL